MLSTVGSFPLIYNNKKAILNSDREVNDLPLWNITYASGHTRLSPPIEVWQVMRRMRRARRSQSPAATQNIRLYNKIGIMGKRLASKALTALSALAIQCESKAIFGPCTHAKSDMPLSHPCWGKCAELRVLHYVDTHTQTHRNTHPNTDTQRWEPWSGLAGTLLPPDSFWNNCVT